MTSIKDSVKVAALKINNSYESEPSSGSGSSNNDNEYTTIDDDNMNLPYLMKPPLYAKETEITTDLHISNPEILIPCKKPKGIFASPLLDVKQLKQISPNAEKPLPTSSQESSFEGFTDSPFGKIQRNLAAKYNSVAIHLKTTDEVPKDSITSSPFVKFSILEENSCNAVDLQLSSEKEVPKVCEDSNVSKSLSFSLAYNNSDNSAIGSTSELSFNGRIKSLMLNESEPTKCKPVTTLTCGDIPSTSSASMVNGDLLLGNSIQNIMQTDSSFLLKKFNNERSPDVFAEEDDDEDEVEDQSFDNKELSTHAEEQNSKTRDSSFGEDKTWDCTSRFSATVGSECSTQNTFEDNCRRETEMLRRIRKCLAGVPPPPTFTILQMNMFDAILNRKSEILSFNEDIQNAMKNSMYKDNAGSCSKPASLLKPTHSLDEVKTMDWKDVLHARHHGLCYNINKASESKEYLSLSVVERYIGSETASSLRHSPSSAKKRSSRLKLLAQSPGNRLSHLARRRAIFSSANLATTSQKSTSSVGLQILLDDKKPKHRRKATPKRKTPGSKKKSLIGRRTPSSSARKRLYTDLTKPAPSRETSKRALFQSPAKQKQEKKPIPIKPLIKPEIANRVEKSRRALFSPDNHSQNSASSFSLFKTGSQISQDASQPSSSSSTLPKLDSVFSKRKRTHDNEDDAELDGRKKLFRSEILTPRSMKIKSQSFCLGAGTSSRTATSFSANSSMGSRNNSSGIKMQRAHSDVLAQSNSLTENQRKKLLWAVSQALQERKISNSHESFKQYASVLGRVVKRIFQEYYQNNTTSNSDTFARLAKKYVHNVLAGKTADDLYFQARAQQEERKLQSNFRLTGYIGQDEYQQRKNLQALKSSLQKQTELQQQMSRPHSNIATVGGSMQNLFATENSIDSSFSINSQVSSTMYGNSQASFSISQSSLLDRLSQESAMTQNSTIDSKLQESSRKLSIQPNPQLHNSSSKNNNGLALRENVDCDQRQRSGQKNFTGKDQRNTSPYVGASALGGPSSHKKPSTPAFSHREIIDAKVKRQILFDI